MDDLIFKISSLVSKISLEVNLKLNEFKKINKGSNEDYFYELCFCILTANTSAKMGLMIQSKVKVQEFLNLDLIDLKKKLNSLGCRFYNRRSEFIFEARKFKNLKDILSKYPNNFEKRDFLAKNIKGIGYKEASHFLRNTGHFDVAILDKHVKNLLFEHNLISIDLKEKSLNQKQYLEIEEILLFLANKLNMSQGELDYYLWYLKTGKILK